MRIVAHIALAATLVAVDGSNQTAKKPDVIREKHMFATNEFFSKGGLGIINPNLYIVVKSAKNGLRIGKSESWFGLDASKPEVIIVFDGKVWESGRLPEDFDLSKAIIVSFEGDK